MRIISCIIHSTLLFLCSMNFISVAMRVAGCHLWCLSDGPLPLSSLCPITSFCHCLLQSLLHAAGLPALPLYTLIFPVLPTISPLCPITGLAYTEGFNLPQLFLLKFSSHCRQPHQLPLTHCPPCTSCHLALAGLYYSSSRTLVHFTPLPLLIGPCLSGDTERSFVSSGTTQGACRIC